MFTHVRLPDADCYRDRSRLLCSYCRNTCPGEVQRARHFLAFDLCLQWSCSSDKSSSKMHKVLRLPRKSSSRYTKCCACHAKAVGPRRRVQVLHCRSQQLAVMSFNKCHEHPSKACHRKQIHFVRVATQVQGSYRRNTCAVRRGADGASCLGFRHGPGFRLSSHRPTGVLEPDPRLEAALQNCITV